MNPAFWKQNYRRILTLLLALTLPCALLILLSFPILVQDHSEYSCSDSDRSYFIGDDSLLQCSDDYLGHRWYVFKVQNTQNTPLRAETLKINPKYFPDGITIEVTSPSAPPIFGIGKPPSFIDGTTTLKGWNIVRSGQFTHSSLQQGIFIGVYEHLNGRAYYRLSPSVVAHDREFRPSIYNGGASIWITCVYVVSIIELMLVFLIYKKDKKKLWGVLSAIIFFLLAYLTFASPTRGEAGYIDTADDAYYLAYINGVTEHGSLFNCDFKYFAPGVSARIDNHDCYGYPGTSLLMGAPVLFKHYFHTIRGAIGGEKGEIIHRISPEDIPLLRASSALYSLGATIILFLVFQNVSRTPFAILLAVGMLWGTSLIAWTFGRAIFSHSIEIFLLSMCLLLILKINQQQFSSTYRRLGLLALGATAGLLIITRGEYLLFLFLLPLFLFNNVDYRQGINRNGLKNSVKDFAYIIASALPFLLFLREIKSHTAYGNTVSASIFKSVSDVFSPSIIDLFFHHCMLLIQSIYNSGLIIIWGVLVIVWMQIKKIRNPYFPLNSILIFMGAYFVLTAIFHTPLGMEWQHRYLLKLYPFALIGMLLYFESAPLVGKIFTLVVFIYSMVKEFMTFESDHDSRVIRDELIRIYFSDGHLMAVGYNPQQYYKLLYAIEICIFVTIIMIGVSYFYAFRASCKK